MLKINCVIVAYNNEIDNLDNIRPLITNKINAKIIICDNSEKKELKIANYKFCEENYIKYIDMHGNKGLSKAYNEAIKELDNDSWMVIFDQDTDISQDYFVELGKSLNSYPNVNIHVPIVKSKRCQISPSQLKKYRVKSIELSTPGIYTGITAINSGMAIKKEVFNLVGNYNEKIFLDYLDHFFIKEYRKHFKEIAVFNSILNQDFSDDDHSNFLRDLNRFRIYSNDFYEFCKDSLEGRIYCLMKLSFRASKLSMMHKKLDFFKIALERRKE
ncbi:glycosyltransferase [Paenisporosarcina quisquiliarum]|uniref:glycosyltransferase n=1 Tax=Paenisporosarcina quisquiliarum TaxID=365346 RepID=UPI0037354E03